MTVRFNTWIEADSLEEAWERLRLSLTDKNLVDKLKEEFTATVLEDPEEDKKELAPVTVKELRDYSKGFATSCNGCVLHDEDEGECWLGYSCPQLLEDEDIDEIAKKIRGEKE